jgi:hypothetical protein
MRENLLELINSGKVDELACMMDGCKFILSQPQLEMVFTKSPEIIEKI